MNAWKARRFWTAAEAVKAAGGHTVQLDGRPLRTPAKSPLTLPNAAMARAVAAEWDAQQDRIDPRTMPVTRAANAAIDKVARQFAEVADMLAAYGDSDLTCYRAAGPQGLVERQNAAWNPLLDWAADRFGARLIAVEGVVHRPQPPASLARLRAPLDAMTAFELTAMHDLVSLSGSLVIGLAAAEAHLPPAELWARSRTDEDWQIEQWGPDQESAETAEFKRRSFLEAVRFLELTQGKAPAVNV